MPFLVLSGTLGVELNGEFVKSILILIALAIAYIFGLFFLSKPLSKNAGGDKKQGMMRFCSIFANNGFLGIPLARAVFGADSLAVAYLIVLNILNNILMFTLGIYLISGDKKMMKPKKAILNPVLITFAVGILLNLLKVNSYVPEIGTYSNHFSNIVTPMSMTILGMKLGGVKFSSLFTSGKMYRVALLKLLIYPVIGVALFWGSSALFRMGTAVILASFVAFATPTAGLSSTFSDRYDGDTEGAVAYTLGTTVLSIGSIPVLYWALCLLL
jgi:predicted permease